MSEQSDVRDVVLSTSPLGMPWRTPSPFLFCVHHDDQFPPGNEHLGPAASLEGRDIGQDFEGKDGWRMYHGETIPGFPHHPHRGFETVTIVREGLLDHADSLGAAARFGGGDVQWLTAGKGILHSEMFPLLNRDKPNPVELFQIWLNLPRKNKLVEPYFSMLWRERIPKRTFPGGEVVVVAGTLEGLEGLPPPPDSWASQPGSDVAIWTLKLAPGARWTLPAAPAGVNRTLYFFKGGSLKVGGKAVPPKSALELRAEAPAPLEAGGDEVELLMLQGRPIQEPVVQYGPFVMNTREEIQQAFADYQRTQFGGWPWESNDPVHPLSEGRFARHADGHIERPG